jgi:hypothetical protein
MRGVITGARDWCVRPTAARADEVTAAATAYAIEEGGTALYPSSSPNPGRKKFVRDNENLAQVHFYCGASHKLLCTV